MRLEARWTPKAIVALAMGSSYFPILDLVMVALVSHFAPLPDSFRAWALLWGFGLILPSGLAVWTSLKCVEAIRRGLMDELWPPTAITEISSLLQSKALVWSSGCLIVTGFLATMLSLVVDQSTHHKHMNGWGGLIYFFIAPSTTRGALLKLLAPPRQPGDRTWLHNLKPLVSSHWGEH